MPAGVPEHLDYRRILRTNLKAVLARAGDTTTSAARKALYLDGTKRGQRVSARSLRYFLDENGPSPGVDALAAIAAAYDLMLWQLLVPDLDPENPPHLALSATERELYKHLAALREALLRSK